jgi:small conductance mechanosensitive channel
MLKKISSRLIVLLPSLILVSCANDTTDTPPPSLSNTFDTILADFLAFMPKLLSALVLFVLTLYLANLLSRLVRSLMQRRRADPGISLLIYHVTRWGLIITGTAAALQQVDFQLTAFLAGLGILGFTIVFALQDISQNVVAGLLLLIQKPFEIDDLIEVESFRGHVRSVDLRSTELHTLDGHNVLIPNASVFTTPIINYSRQATWRVSLDVGVAYDSDLEQVRRVTLQAVRNIPDILSSPSPDLYFHTFNDSSIDFSVRYWIDARQINPFTATDPAVVAIQRAYVQAGIEIPFPIQTEIQVTKNGKK